MRRAIRRLDALQRRLGRVYEFTADPTCLLRLQLTQAPHDLVLRDRVVPAGVPVLALHLWNQQVPSIPGEGADMAWALHTTRAFVRSLRAVGAEMLRNSGLEHVRAVGALSTGVFGSSGQAGPRIFERLGFGLFTYHSRLGAFGEFWENVYSWWLMWAYNAASLRNRRLLGLRRSEFWMSKEEFLARYGRQESTESGLR
jgi:hypothetical protein